MASRVFSKNQNAYNEVLWFCFLNKSLKFLVLLSLRKQAFSVQRLEI